MKVTDLWGIGRVAAEVRRLVLGILQFKFERETRKVINDGIRIINDRTRSENIALQIEQLIAIVQMLLKSDLKLEDRKELLATLQELLTILMLLTQHSSDLLIDNDQDELQ